MTKPALKTPINAAFEVVEKMPLANGAADSIESAWKQVRSYIDNAAFFLRASLASQIMAGFVLLELHKAYAGSGRRNDLGQKGLGWEEALKKHGSIAKTTARRLMEMAIASKKRLGKDTTGLREILARYPGMVTPAELELLEKAVHKISDGYTQTEFLLECGITKAPQGSGARGGNMGGGGHVATTAAIADRIRDLMEDRCNLLKEDLRNRPWRPASDEVRKRYLGLLTDIAAAVREDARESAKEGAK